MQTDSKSSISPSALRRLWGLSILSSILLLLLNVWEWTQDKSRWPGFLITAGLLLLGSVNFFASRNGLLHKVGSILAIILMLSYIPVTLLVK